MAENNALIPMYKGTYISEYMYMQKELLWKSDTYVKGLNTGQVTTADGQVKYTMYTRVEEIIEEALKCFDVLNTAIAESIDQLESRESSVRGVTNGCGEFSIFNLICGNWCV